jgi:hypothetical protein
LTPYLEKGDCAGFLFSPLRSPEKNDMRSSCD